MNLEFFYLVILSGIIAFASGTAILALLFSFIPFFSFHIPSFIQAILATLLLGIFLSVVIIIRNSNLKKYI